MGGRMPPKRHKRTKTFFLALPAGRVVNYCASAIRVVIPETLGVCGL
jgi:hypothetical protein